VLRRYFLSIFQTWAILRRERPEVVVVNNLPVFSVMAVWLGGLFLGHRIVLDVHSGMFTSPVWSRFAPFYRYIVARSPFTLAHNHYDGVQLSAWGGTVVHMTALPRDFPHIIRQPAPKTATMLVVCSYQPDEPIETLLNVMRALPSIHFVLTGNFKKRGLVPQDLPANIELSGFMPHEEYLQRMAQSTAAVTFSDRPQIMQMAVHEAISLGVPVVTNHSQTLKRVLEDGGVQCALDAPSMIKALQDAAARAQELREAAGQLKPRRVRDVQIELDRVRAEHPDLFA